MDSKTNYKNMLLALLLILAGLAGAIAPQTAAAKVYTIMVGDVQITSENAANITGPNITGKVSFDESTHTLILNNATIDGGSESAIHYFATGEIFPPDGITIRLQGNNTLKSGIASTISALVSIRITGGGSLTIKSGNRAIEVAHADKKDLNLTIDGCTLTADRRIDVKGSLQINNSNVTVSDRTNGYTFKALNSIALSGCQIVSPYGAQIKKVKSFDGEYYTVVTDLGDMCEKVIIEPGNSPKPPEPGPEAKLTLDPKELKVDSEESFHSVTLSGNVSYHVNDYDKPAWLSVSGHSAGYEKSQTLTIVVKPNTGAERTADVVIKTDKGNVTLKVTQAGGAKPDPEAKLTLDPKELKVDAKGGEHQVSLSSEQDFELNEVTLLSWMNQNPSLLHKGPGLFICTFTFKPNTGAERTANIVFHTDLGNVKLKVTQAAGNAKPDPEAKLTLDPKELKVEADGGKKEVKLSCNQAFELNKVTVPSWMERVPSSATSDEKSRVCAFNIQKNTGAERIGEIIFHTDKGNVTLKVTQAGGAKPKPEPTLTLSTDMLTFPTGGGKQTVNVKSDYGWDTKASAASASWMKLTTDVKTGTIVVEVTPNTSTKKRGATIQVISSRRRIGYRTPITRHILVTQEAAKAVEPPVAATGISLNPAAITMGGSGGTVGFNVYAGKGWTISGSPEWMHPDATRGSGTRLVIVRFDRNESGAERTGKLTVKSDDGKAERTFTLTQRAGQRKPTPSPGSTPSDEYDYDLALNPEEITVGPSDGAGSSISVATSRLWAGSTTEDWIRLESAVGRGNGTFTFTVAPNPSKEMRHGTITVRTQQGMDELKVAIHQQGNDGTIVSPAEVKVSNVTLDPATLTVNGDLSTALISAIVSPDNARNKGLLWMSSNASVATVQVFTPTLSGPLPQLRFAPDADDYALVTIVGKGKATITATASDGSGIVARCEVNVLSTVANTVPYAPQAKVYTVGPTLYLSLPTAETVQVYTLAGTLYRTWQAPAGDTSLTLPAGTYIIKVGQLTEKVVVR